MMSKWRQVTLLIRKTQQAAEKIVSRVVHHRKRLAFDRYKKYTDHFIRDILDGRRVNECKFRQHQRIKRKVYKAIRAFAERSSLQRHYMKRLVRSIDLHNYKRYTLVW